mmetsp:Transcript_33253/g.89002  ORF Transcript_33253/g.89002 Transcript_33253/m.89002 type:complete len:211 (-) Transcript_33253:97-729(-)
MGNSSFCSCQHVSVGKEFMVSTLGCRPVDPFRTRPMPVGSMQDVASDRINVWHSSLQDSVEFGLARVVEATSDAWNCQTSHAAPVGIPRNTRLEFDGDSRPDNAARRTLARHLPGDDRRFDTEHAPQLPVLLPPGSLQDASDFDGPERTLFVEDIGQVSHERDHANASAEFGPVSVPFQDTQLSMDWDAVAHGVPQLDDPLGCMASRTPF